MTAPDVTRALLTWLHEEGATDDWVAAQLHVGRQRAHDARVGRPGTVGFGPAMQQRVAALVRRVASGDVQPPGFRDARRRKLQAEKRRRHRAAAQQREDVNA